MARKSILVDLVEATSRVPWWLAAALGGGLYYAFKYVLPTQMSGTYQAALAPVFSMFAYLTLGACLLGALIGVTARVREYVVFKRQKSIVPRGLVQLRPALTCKSGNGRKAYEY